MRFHDSPVKRRKRENGSEDASSYQTLASTALEGLLSDSQGESGMTNRSPGSVSGWIYSLVVALVCIGMTLYWQHTQSNQIPGVKFPVRTSLVPVVEAPTPKLAIHSEPLSVDSSSFDKLVDHETWTTYRSETPLSIAMLEPAVTAKLQAPLATDLPDPFLNRTNAKLAQAQKLPQSIAINSIESNSSPLIAQQVSNLKTIESESETPAAFLRPATNLPVGRSKLWPTANQLITDAKALSEFVDNGQDSTVKSELISWISNVTFLFEKLSTTEITSEQSAELIAQAKQLSGIGFAWAESNLESKYPLAIRTSWIAQSLQRRSIVWDKVYQCMRATQSEGYVPVSAKSNSLDFQTLSQHIAVVRDALNKSTDRQSWITFLMLDRLDSLANGEVDSHDEQVAIAREFLNRVTFNRVSPDQKAVLASEEIRAIAEDIHPLTVIPVDYRKLLADLETIEQTPIHRASVDIAETIQSLRFSDSDLQYAIADALNQNYRSANIRLSVSEDFINRMMPKDQVSSKPVQQRILGADTRGASQVMTNLHVDLLPDAKAWKFSLQLDGNIHSTTRSSRSGATFYNSSKAKVQSSRELRLDPTSLTINGTPATVESQESLRKFSTKWDQLPIMGDMVRYVAKQEFNQSKPVARRITQKLIANQTDSEFDSQLQENLDQARDQLSRRLLGPLQQLQLHPMIVDMQSTDTRLVARYRIAGNDQIAANTPRPLAPADCLMSFQLHQSSMNNLVAQALLSDKDWSIAELAQHVASLLQIPPPTLPEDTPQDVTIRFADVHPMSVEFLDGKMLITMRIASLEQPGKINLKNFTVKTAFTPQVSGLQAELVRDSVISIDGHRMGSKDRFPLRAIFAKVLSDKTNIPLVSQELINDPRSIGLKISQLEMEQGWLAIALSDIDSAIENPPSTNTSDNPLVATDTKENPLR